MEPMTEHDRHRLGTHSDVAWDDAVCGPPVDLNAAERLSVRDLLAAYALLRGCKVALPHPTTLRAAFPALFRSRACWSAGAWQVCDEACLDVIRTLLRRRGRLYLVTRLERSQPV